MFKLSCFHSLLHLTVNNGPRLHTDDCDYALLCSAVKECGSARWKVLGLAMGFTDNQVEVLTQNTIDFSDKVQLIVDAKRREVGELQAKESLLKACSAIEPPIIEPVREKLTQKN